MTLRRFVSPAFSFIQKPFDGDVFRTLVERCIELRCPAATHRARRSAAISATTPLLDTILDDVQRMIAGKFQQDDLTLLTARVSLAGR